MVARVEQKLRQTLKPMPLEAGPAPGQWRQERLDGRRSDHLFADILVPITGEAGGWHALDLALAVAQQEGGQIKGLHLVSAAAQKGSQAVQLIKAEFQRRCQAAAVPGELAIETGKVVNTICERARWADLVVMYPANPPGAKLVSRLTSGSRNVIYGSCRPVLTVPGPAARPERVLLAYDGSPKAQEGLYVAAYLAGHWGAWLVVMTVIESEGDTGRLAQARDYLSARGVSATYVPGRGDVAQAILSTAEQQASDLIVIGGYGVRPMREVVLGSKVDQILRQAQRPVLVCR
jgi:nucleotide-binding universal stress UspA family protein